MKKVLSQCIVSEENPYISALHCKGVMSICMTPVWRTEKEFPDGMSHKLTMLKRQDFTAVARVKYIFH